MMYFWLIPLLLLLVVAMTFFFRDGTRRSAIRQSRLDGAYSQEHEEKERERQNPPLG